jgi:hypothetical protein
VLDADWYRSRYPDVAAARVDPLEHFVAIGWREGRDPGPAFSVSHYLETNPDVAAAGVNPLAHYLDTGWRERRAPRPDFDHAAHAERQTLDEEGIPLVHEAARRRGG